MARDEEKQFEVTVNRLIDYAKGIKVSLVILIQRIETEGDNMDWPQVLDSFANICGEINTLMRFTRENRSQYIENRVVLPLKLSPDRDEDLAKLTEGRVQLVNHEMVPDYLRTKPDPEIEEFEKNLQIKASTISPDIAVKQVTATNTLIKNMLEKLKTGSARADNEISRQSILPSYNQTDTNELIAAVCNGQGLIMGIPQSRSMTTDGPSMPRMDPTRQPVMQRPNVRAPELRTNIRPAP